MTSISYKSIETEISSKDCINLNGKKKLNQRININNKKFCQNEESKQNSSLESETNGNELSLNYRPKLFLRCHCKDNDPFDNETAIWSASFQPKSSFTDGNRFVATCGRNMVCIIDCDKAFDESCGRTVIARYIDSDKDEELVSLAWNVVPFNCEQSINETTILAVGGKRNILLMSTDDFHCYERIQNAHLDQINALRFHPNNNTLFSGSYDRKIKIWKISFPNDKSITEMLAFVETRNNALLSLCYSLKYDTIIASGTEGLFLWSDISNYSQNPMLGSIKTRRLVDGLDTIPGDDDSIVCRIYGSNVITILDLKQAIDEMKNQKSDNKIKIRPILLSKVTKAKLESFEGDYPYIYLSTQTNLLVSGGPKGQIWLYETNKFSHYDLKRIGKPDRIIEWPAIENITKDDRNIIDDQKFVIINTVSISADLKYLIACTNSNLVCVWHQS